MDCLIKAKGNISRCELTGFEKLEQNIDNPEWNRFRAVILLVCLLTQVCGNTMCLSIWSYERYGGDPQKRTILNQLTGQLVMHCVFANLTSLATFMFRLAFGPISTFWVEATYFISNAHVGITSVFAFSEIAILKFLSIFIWKRLPPINEEFLGLFFRIANHSVGLMFALFGRKGSSKNHELYYILTGLPLMSDQNEPIFRFFSLPLMITIEIHVLYGLALLCRKLKLWLSKRNAVTVMPIHPPEVSNRVNNQAATSAYNNIAANYDLISFIINGLVLGSLFVYLLTVSWEWEDNMIQPVVLGWIIPYFTMIFIVPLKICLSNKDIWHHIRMSQLSYSM